MSTFPSGVCTTSCAVDPDVSVGGQSSKNQKFKSRGFTLLALLIVVTASFLRIWTLQRESIEGDEVFSRIVAMADTGTSFRLVKEDLVHPPLYYFLLKATLPVTGTSVTGIRLLSLVSGIASIVVVLLWGIAVPFLKRPTLLAAALLALNPTHIFYSQQARSYALYGLEVCLLILWVLILDKAWTRRAFWLVGTILMTALFYTHYVGALFAGVIVISILTRQVSPIVKLRSMLAATFAVLAFIPWLITEAVVFRTKHGLSSNLGWKSLPDWYDLRALWASFLGVPQFRGGMFLSFSVAMLLTGLAVYGKHRGRSRIARADVRLLLWACVFPALLLFSTKFKPLALTVFDERYLLPAIFPFLVLVATGLMESAALFRSRKILIAAGVTGLCSLQLLELSVVSLRPRRQPYSTIALALKDLNDRPQAVYTTWPWGIGQPVNFYLDSNIVQPLPPRADLERSASKTFALLYRPTIQKEEHQVTTLLRELANIKERCQYYASPAGKDFGTQLCIVNWTPMRNGPGNLPNVLRHN